MIRRVRVAIFLPSLTWGGAERVGINLANALIQENCSVEVVVATDNALLRCELSPEIRVVSLGKRTVAHAIPRLIAYLRGNRPQALISHLSHANLAAIVARRLSGIDTRLLVVEHIGSQLRRNNIKSYLIPYMCRYLYRSGVNVVSVSNLVSRDLEHYLGLKQGTITTIYNPVIGQSLIAKANMDAGHPWLNDTRIPTLLAAGRFVRQKDFHTLIRAFAIVRKTRPVRLVVLGDGPLRPDLEALVSRLQLSEHVSMPGFIENPFAYMKRANVFVLSSTEEGLPTVLVEAMACGSPVVATDCAGGIREVISAEGIDKLVPVGDHQAMAEMILDALENPIGQSVSEQWIEKFSSQTAARAYLSLVEGRRAHGLAHSG
ncbi:glycosyltransferase [Gammaproteobacteria bacterium]|nr:glycosyltransferase [Gammaproteobacteria bacterium]